jgi:hypothetical protein
MATHRSSTTSALRVVVAAAVAAVAFLLPGSAAAVGIPPVQLGPLAWSPDGKTIAFARFANEVTRVVVMKPDGTKRKVIWARRNDDRRWYGLTDLAYSPDGRLLALGGHPQLVVLDPSRRTHRECRLAAYEGFTWGPGSERVVTSFESFAGQLTVLSVKNCRRHQLTGLHDSTPSWSPDGKWIAFVRGHGTFLTPDDTCPCDVYVRRPRGGRLTRLTRTARCPRSGRRGGTESRSRRGSAGRAGASETTTSADSLHAFLTRLCWCYRAGRAMEGGFSFFDHGVPSEESLTSATRQRSRSRPINGNSFSPRPAPTARKTGSGCFA